MTLLLLLLRLLSSLVANLSAGACLSAAMLAHAVLALTALYAVQFAR